VSKVVLRSVVNSGDLVRHLVQAQQPGQVQRVTLVGLDPVTAGPLQLARRRDLTPHARFG
jgi:hypothetical protein